MTEPTFVLPPQPLLATDIAGFALLTLAAIYAGLWWRDREPGMNWLALFFGVFGLWWTTTRWHLPTSENITQPLWLVMAIAGIAALMIGLIRYLGVPAATRRWVMPTLLAFPALAVVLAVASMFVPVSRAFTSPLIALCVLGCVALALDAQRREPGAGHGIVAAALSTLPLFIVALRLYGTDVVMVRYLGPLPLIFFGVVLLTVSLLRRRRALEAEIARRAEAEAALATLNASLEQQVQQRTADLQEMVAGLESFNRSVSHDLRGPLGGIAQLAGMAEDALARGDAATALRMLPAIRQQSESSHTLVAALLALARVGDAPMQRERVDLGALAREVAASLRAGADPAAAVEVEIDPLPSAMADPALLRAVFTNLLGNAIKFSSGRRAALVRVQAQRDADAVTVHVVDNGAGFDAAAAAELFEPFRRLHGARFEGHGVGLSIVRRAVERHGGRVWAEGRPGEGATFSFSLPAAAA